MDPFGKNVDFSKHLEIWYHVATLCVLQLLRLMT